MNPNQNRLSHAVAALSAEASSTRLQAALAVGTRPDPDTVDVLVERCAVEPDFFVRDMLTWALTRLPQEVTLPRLLAELKSERAQARSQALHSLSKLRNRNAYPAITRSLLDDADDDVARTAWRAAVVLVPEGEEATLAAELATHLGRGDRNVQLSLSRALVDLGEVIVPALHPGAVGRDPRAQAHAHATVLLLRDPDAGFDVAVEEAKRLVALGGDWVREDDDAPPPGTTPVPPGPGPDGQLG
ncbi:HEAT repeat domain-containing protein [Pilimelia columellifera]|uniref:HEAT repeat domain-containing protein n=1 Tax=Pilimelia columellifera subsp. columellifera TaxID=706583 RepID=A0ABP6AXR0_9ACTN